MQVAIIGMWALWVGSIGYMAQSIGTDGPQLSPMTGSQVGSPVGCPDGEKGCEPRREGFR